MGTDIHAVWFLLLMAFLFSWACIGVRVLQNLQKRGMGLTGGFSVFICMILVASTIAVLVAHVGL